MEAHYPHNNVTCFSNKKPVQKNQINFPLICLLLKLKRRTDKHTMILCTFISNSEHANKKIKFIAILFFFLTNLNLWSFHLLLFICNSRQEAGASVWVKFFFIFFTLFLPTMQKIFVWKFFSLFYYRFLYLLHSYNINAQKAT